MLLVKISNTNKNEQEEKIEYQPNIQQAEERNTRRRLVEKCYNWENITQKTKGKFFQTGNDREKYKTKRIFNSWRNITPGKY